MSRRLRAEIETELANLSRVAADITQLAEQTRTAEPGTIEIAAAAAFLHAFYNGVENVLKRIFIACDGGVPTGTDWHAALLETAGKPSHTRAPVFTPDLIDRLKPYLQFRHVFRHAYTFDLKWARMRPLAEDLASIAGEVADQLAEFSGSLDDEG